MFRIKFVNVEIVVMLVYFANFFTDAIFTNLIIYRTCYVTLKLNASACGKLGTKRTDADDATLESLEKRVQPHANDIIVYTNMIQAVGSALVCTILGPWSDRNGRKPVLISTTTGLLLSYAIKATLSYFSTIPPWFFLLNVVPIIITGGLPSLYTVALCYIIDSTDSNTRGIKMSFYEAFSLIGMLIGSFIGGYVYDATNYTTVFVICTLTMLANLLYVVFIVDETVTIDSTDTSRRTLRLKEIFDVFATIFGKRDNRSTLLIVYTVLGTFIASYMSLNSVQFMYFRLTFHWDLEKYTMFQGAMCITWTIGNLIVVWLFHKRLRCTEKTIVAICISFAIGYYTIMAFATKLWHIITALLLRLPSGAVIPVLRTLISTITLPTETGKIFSFTVILESVASVIGIPLYIYLYDLMLNAFPSIIYAVSGVINVFSFGLMVCLFCKVKK